MSYSDILNTTQLYGDLLRKNFSNTANNISNVRYNAGPVNPNSSAAFVPKTARDIYGYSSEVNNPLAEYSDYKPYKGIENILLQIVITRKYFILNGGRLIIIIIVKHINYLDSIIMIM